MNFIAPIVEGHGELDALPELLRRIASETMGTYVTVNPPFRVHADAFLKFESEFKRSVRLIAGKAAENSGMVLILLDCEDRCPAELGPQILRRAEAERSDVPYVVCLAYREFETWFLYGARSLAGLYGLPADLDRPSDPEVFRDAKGWLAERMPRGYKETSHQVAFAARMDLGMAAQSASFKRLLDRLAPFLRQDTSRV